jgi:hypothetical protein
MPTEPLSVLFDEFIRKSFLNCKIERSDGHYEDFDPLTLFSSLIECEIDIVNAVHLFDEIIVRIEKIVTNPSAPTQLSHRDIHDIVSTEILRYPHRFAPFWLSNYEGMFSRDIQQEDSEEEYIDVRNAGSLREEIKVFLAGQRDSVHKDSSDLSEITNRIIKLIRFCGFYKVRREFIKDLLHELSTSSSKAYIPDIALSDEQFMQGLEAVRRMLLIVPELTTDQHFNFCSTIISKLSSNILGWLGVLYSPNNPQLVRQVKAVLDDLYRTQKVKPGPFRTPEEGDIASLIAVRSRLDKFFGRSGLKPDVVADAIDALIEAINRKYVAESLFFAEKIVRYFELLISENDLLKSLHEFEFGDDPSRYLQALAAQLTSQGGGQPVVGDGFIDIAVDYKFHKIIEYGAKLRLCLVNLASEEELNRFDFNRIIEWADEDPAVIFCLVIKRGRGGEFLNNMRNAIKRCERLISVVRRDDLERDVLRGDDIRTLIQREFLHIFPEGASWQQRTIFDIKEPILPQGLRHRERDLIRSALGAIEKGPETTPTIQVLHILESRIREHILLIIALQAKMGSRSDAVVRRVTGASELEFVEYPKLLRELYGQRSHFSERVQRLLLSEKEIRELDELRRFRNLITHNDLIIDTLSAKDAVVRAARVIARLSELSQGYVKVGSDSKLRNAYFYDSEEGEVTKTDDVFWEAVPLEGVRKGQPRFRLGYVDRKDRRFSFLAFARCTECQKASRMMAGAISNRYVCEASGCNPQMEGDWAQFTARLRVTEPKGRSIALSPPEGPMRESDVKGSWLRSICEGLVVALGPAGAPIKVVLDRVDKRDLDRLEEKIDHLIARGDIREPALEKAEHALGGVLGGMTFSRPIQLIVRGWFRRYAEEREARSSIFEDFMPVGASLVTEKELVSELTRLYPEVDLAISDFKRANIDVSRIRRTGIPTVDLENLVIGIRGQEMATVFRLAQRLRSSNPGSPVLTRLEQSLDAFVRSNIE